MNWTLSLYGDNSLSKNKNSLFKNFWGIPKLLSKQIAILEILVKLFCNNCINSLREEL